MRLLWHSNAPFQHSGYGNQTALFVPRINRLGYPTAVSAFSGLHLGTLTWDGVQVYPHFRDRWGQDVLRLHAKHYGADALISLCDVLIMKPDQFVGLPWLPWTPIDAATIRPEEVPILKRAYRPIAMSRYGERLMQEAGMQPAYAPHGVDTSVFSPGPCAEAREAVSLPTDRYIVGMVAANQGRPSRKAFPEQLQAFAEFKKRHPDAYLYLHTVLDRSMDGIDLKGLLGALGLTSNDWATCPQYLYLNGLITSEALARLYRSLDVLLSVSWGEGFGIPILEAQACGTPVIVGDWSAMSELAFGGWKVPTSGAQKVWNNFDTWMYSPKPEAILDCLEEAWRTSPSPHPRTWARQGALAYDADTVAETYWKPILDALAEELGLVAREAVTA